MINKITVGYVIQTWDNKKKCWLSQNFIAGDEVTYEDEDGDPVDVSGEPENEDGTEPYLPFDMVQPE